MTLNSHSSFHTAQSLLYAANHVFFPASPPDKNDYAPENNHTLARAISSAAHTYAAHTRGSSEEAQWHRIARMLGNLETSLQSEYLDFNYVITQLRGMRAGDILTFFIQGQNLAILLTKQEDSTLYQSFEVSPSKESFSALPGPLICSYPSSATEMPNEVFDDGDFQAALAKFLVRGLVDSAVALPSPADPQYLDELLGHLLQYADSTFHISRQSNHTSLPFGTGPGTGRILPQVTKHVRDHIGIGDPPWRRSPFLLLSKVVIQLSVITGSLQRSSYKRFILYFMCILALDESNTSLSSDLLHLMSSTILRRLHKLGDSSCNWLSEMAVKTSDCLLGILDVRWEQLTTRRSSFQNPSMIELVRDTELSFSGSRDRIRSALADRDPEMVHTPFHPNHARRGNITDFLSLDGSFFDGAYATEPDLTLHDVERSVEEGIDDWLACVSDVDEACAQLECLMDKYLPKAHLLLWHSNPEHLSIRILTMLELYVALDKLVVKKIPMLADYPPPIPAALLEYMILRRTTNLHRLACAYQYLSMRHSRSRPGWSAISSEFTENSFPVRYYDLSQDLQQLKARIVEDIAMKDVRRALTLARGYCAHICCRGHQIGPSIDRESPLSLSPLLAKVVAFELRCPACFRIWRSAAPRILYCLDDYSRHDLYGQKYDLLPNIPAFQPYCVEHKEPRPHTEICLAYFHPVSPQSHHAPTFQYIIQHTGTEWSRKMHSCSTWPPEEYLNSLKPSRLRFRTESHCTSCKSLEKYVDCASHTANGVLSAQADCPADLTLDEFIAFAHLRSCGCLQWLNILHGLRSRTLNLRRHAVHFLLSHAASQVGPLNLDTGVWIWHQVLQDASFCNTLLDELESSLSDARAGLMDGVLMNTISLLLTRVLASSPGKDVSEKAIILLQIARRNTFNWVQELSYDLIMEPTSKERNNLMRDMAATCRSTFDFEPVGLRHPHISSEDVDTVLSCAFFSYTLLPSQFQYMKINHPQNSHSDRLFHQYERDQYSQLLLQRNSRLSLTIEQSLRAAILADTSDYSIDLAVAKIFASHRPGACKWAQLQHPNDRWFTCETEKIIDQPLRNILVDLVDGTLRVNGRVVGGLPEEIRNSTAYGKIFRGQGFFIIPSDLPGMDFMTLPTMPEYRIYFTLRVHDFVLKARGNLINDILVLIPAGLLSESLPPALVYNQVPWLNLSTKIIEIRPIEQPWRESPDNWRIDCASERWYGYRGREILVDNQSPTATVVYNSFKCLKDVTRWIHESPSHGPESLVITASPIDSTSLLRLSVCLPGYNLSFFVNDQGELESHDFMDMVYDNDQTAGALFGLENLLILRPKIHVAGTLTPEGFTQRRLLIPNGQFQKCDNDLVRMDKEFSYCGEVPADEPSYYTYIEDTDLGYLTGDGSIPSTAFLARLHAMTNWHRPDPLTGRTGAQTALELLQSAVCRSIMERKALWTFSNLSTQFPQFNSACDDIESLQYWGLSSHIGKSVTWTAAKKRAARRAAYLFPSNATSPLSEDTIHGESDHSTLTGSITPGPESEHPVLSFISTSKSLRYIFDAGVPTQLTLHSLMRDRPAPPLFPRITSSQNNCTTPLPATENITLALDRLFSLFSADCSFHREYLSYLAASAQHVYIDHRLLKEDLVEALREHFVQCRIIYLDALDTLKHSLGPTTDPRDQAHIRFGHWPPITANALLRYLASISSIDIPRNWNKCLISFAHLLLDLQRSRRLLRFALAGLEEELSRELENEGCDGWNPEEHPDWLLIQIQGNFLIRRSQVEAAMEIMSPRSGQNTVMQVNIGEGKSSVIIPIAAAALADGKQLVRVIVPKALTMQTFDLLLSRLGGLANRPIYHLPSTRTPCLDEFGQLISPQIHDLHILMHQCMKERGILLVQPEHVVSLKLLGVEEQLRQGKLVAELLPKSQQAYNHISLNSKLGKLLNDNILARMFRRSSQSASDSLANVGLRYDLQLSEDNGGARVSPSKWFSLQKWIEAHVRDILDESDEILHSRFQLIYTLGREQHMDGYPDRWTIIQQVLRLVKKHAYSLSRYSPDSIHCERSQFQCFPYIRITHPTDIGRRLISLITEDVMTGQLPYFNFRDLSPALHDAIRAFISDENILQIPDTKRRVVEYAEGSTQSYLWSGLLLLRGLLTSDIFLFALSERRWRVDYGLALDLQRKDRDGRPIGRAPTMLAVPYRAKDAPAPNTQFGHPDLTIIFTCLSYYYTGLSKEQLRISFEILLDQDDPSMEYAVWLKDCEGVSDSMQKLGEINLASLEQWDKVIFPLFASNQATIDFYLSRVVFPKEAKQFPWKLSASSWDLAEKRKKLITGFSGTMDGRWLLPMSTAHCELDAQKGSNARVIAYLLRPENDYYMVTQENDKPWTTHALFRSVAAQQPRIRVLLDVGSQILDLSNREVAKAWLDIARDAAGAVYFDERDELMVLSQHGTASPFSSSAFYQQLDRYLFYLDHAHTRGTDIKFPVGSRAAVTLGPKVTKDALVQGCMRMRLLGHGHSVMFFAPQNVDWCIRIVSGKTDPQALVSQADVLCWAIHETWADIQRRAPYWAQQGMNHRARYHAWSRFCDNEISTEQLSAAWLQHELTSLEDLYAPRESNDLQEVDPEIRQRCKILGVLSLPRAQMDEQQEREIHREREREREVELPPRAEPAEHFLHPDVATFVKTGIIPPLHGGSAFCLAFTTLAESLGVPCEPDVWSPFILATADFFRTVQLQSTGTEGTMDEYLRPVQWILSCEQDRQQMLVLLSPFEADHLLPDIKASNHVHLHLYAPRTSQRITSAEDLRLYSIPPLPSDWMPPWDLIDQLNIFAGQLYLKDHASYIRLCRFLDVPTKQPPSSAAIRRNLFNIPGSFEEMEITFSDSPLPSVMALLAIRTRGKPFAHTHLGRILQGQPLTEKDFQL